MWTETEKDQFQEGEPSVGISLDIRDYNGPLDLLSHLIDERRADLDNLPIAEICSQYFDILNASEAAGIDMDLASEFVLMGSTLLQIKSLLLLPEQKTADLNEGPDPRAELVLRIMAYRRIKILAEEIQGRMESWGGLPLKPAETPESLGIELSVVEDRLDPDKLMLAIRQLGERNAYRFGAANRRIRRILKRERFSVKEKMNQIIAKLGEKKHAFFNEFFPQGKSPVAERVSAFLAVLELLHAHSIEAVQTGPFAVILLRLIPAAKKEGGNDGQ